MAHIKCIYEESNPQQVRGLCKCPEAHRLAGVARSIGMFQSATMVENLLCSYPDCVFYETKLDKPGTVE